MKKMLKRWQVLGKSAAVKTAIAITLVLSLVALPLPGSMGWAQGEAEAAPPAQEPPPEGPLPGQKTRRGLAGSVTSVATTTIYAVAPAVPEEPIVEGVPLVGGDPLVEVDPPIVVEDEPTIATILTIGSNFGDVQVLITDETRIHSPFYEDLSAEDLYGYRLAIHFAKGPANDDGSRIALRIMVIPSRAARTHSYGVIKAKKGGDDGELELVGDDDEVIELGDGVDDGDLDEGDAVVVVTQTVTDFEGDGDTEGHGKPKKIARGLQKASKIMKRLDRIMDRLTELGDSPKAEKLKARVEKFKAKQLKRFDDINARFSGDDSDDGKQNRGRNNRGRPVDVGSTDFGPSDDGDDDGKQNRGRNKGRSTDLSPQDDGDDGDVDSNLGRGRGRNSGKRGGNN